MKAWFASIPPITVTLLLIFASFLSLLLLTYLSYRVRKFWKILNRLKLADRFAIKNDFIKTTAQILGGAFFLFGLYFTWANLVATQEKNVTELYTKAIEQLGNEKMELRLGGIYALERIARESKKDYWPIMQILTAYLRQHAKCEENELHVGGIVYPKLPSDIEAVVAVLKRRPHSFGDGESDRLDLSRTNLCRADFKEADLEAAILYRANLQWALLRKAKMKGAMLEDANLESARMEEADLTDAYLVRADLSNAQLRGSILIGANLSGADLLETDLKDAKGLTKEQVARAFWNEKTRWPEGFTPPTRQGKY
jgi:hypothetical protein